MLKVAMFLGVCIAIYAIFNYLSAKVASKVNSDITMKFLDEYKNEIMPIITENVANELTHLFLNNYEALAKIGVFGVMNEVMNSVSKEKVAETGTEDNKKSTRN